MVKRPLKPRLRKVETIEGVAIWVCSSLLFEGRGFTPEGAYHRWVLRRDIYTQRNKARMGRVNLLAANPGNCSHTLGGEVKPTTSNRVLYEPGETIGKPAEWEPHGSPRSDLITVVGLVLVTVVLAGAFVWLIAGAS